MYQLIAKGRKWLELARAQLSMAPDFTRELEAWQRDVMYPARYDEYRGLPFNQFVIGLHSLVKANNSPKKQGKG
jgi:hypothetical protein